MLTAATTASLLPLIETDMWWIRVLDFPRLQFLIALLVLLPLYLLLRKRSGRSGWGVVLGAVAACGYQAWTLHPYSKLVEPTVMAEAHCTEEEALRIMSANVKRRNESAEVFLQQVEDTDPDLLLVMETDAWWDKRLSVLRDNFPFQVQRIPEDHAFYGMHLFSKLELIAPEFQLLFDAYTPTAATQVRLTSGRIIDFIGVHPRPPLPWSQPTTMRDAHILSAAMSARDTGMATIVAGDFNAVQWESVTRRAIRIGGLLDPRIGRGLYPTFDTKSFLMTWPLDQILFQPQFTLQGFQTLPDFGSDHRAVVVTLCHKPEAVQEGPELRDDDLAKARASLLAAERAH